MHDAIRVAMEFLLIFGETNFVEVLKVREIRQIYGPRNKNTLLYVVTMKLTCCGIMCTMLCYNNTV